MILDIENDEGKLKISYFNRNGDVEIRTYDSSKWYNWVVCAESDKYKDKVYKNWDGRAVKRSRSPFLSRYSIIEFIDSLPKEERDILFSHNLPKIYFIDIEVEISDSFPDAERAQNKITTISVCSSNNTVMLLGTKDLTPSQCSSIEKNINDYVGDSSKKFLFTYKKFDTEYDMMYTFMKSLVPRFPLMVGWNFLNFDWTYIINRCKKLNIDPSISSPSKKTNSANYNSPMHVGVMDYMEMYRKWDKTIEIKENYSLDTAARAVLKKGKIKYDGSLQDLYDRDFEKYVYYNAIDTVLVRLIHDKLKTLEIVLTLANLCKINVYKAAAPVAITESLLCRKFLEFNKVMAKDYVQSSVSKDKQYAGAFVKDPEVGMHKAVACFDYASLYPSVMRQLNVSPESFIYKVNESSIKDEKRDDRIVAVNGCVYHKEESVMKKILDDLYIRRREYKNISQKLEELADETIRKVLEKKKSK